jgi:ABC-type uncharacterized transport system, permease component
MNKGAGRREGGRNTEIQKGRMLKREYKINGRQRNERKIGGSGREKGGGGGGGGGERGRRRRRSCGADAAVVIAITVIHTP